MSSSRSSLARTFTAAGLFALVSVACGGTGPTEPVVVPPVKTLQLLKFAPDTLALRRDSTSTISLIGVYSDGSEAPVTTATWSVSDSSIASLDPTTHLVKGLAAGTTTIIATINRNLTAELPVAVRPPFYVNLSPDGGCLRIGYDFPLTARLYDEHKNRLPDEPAVYSSSDTTLATVNAEGVLRTKAAGVVQVRATIRGETDVSEFTIDPAPAPQPMTCTPPGVSSPSR